MRTGTGALVLMITAAVLLYRRPDAGPSNARAASDETAGDASASPVPVGVGAPESAAIPSADNSATASPAPMLPSDAAPVPTAGTNAPGNLPPQGGAREGGRGRGSVLQDKAPADAQSATGRPTSMAPVPPAAVLVLGSVFFPSGATALGPDASRMLDGIATTYKGTSQQLVIVGHADGRGDAAVNQQLAARRAEAVRNFLAARGIPAGNMQVRSDGARTPMAQGLDPEANAQNRRVEIRLP